MGLKKRVNAGSSPKALCLSPIIARQLAVGALNRHPPLVQRVKSR